MKLATHHYHRGSDPIVGRLSYPINHDLAAGESYAGEVVDSAPRSRAMGWGGAKSVVVILAFCQSLLFLALWMFLCAHAGANAVRPATEFKPDLNFSFYSPENRRDPFTKVGLVVPDQKIVAGSRIMLRLQGILYSSSNPSAMVNNRLVTLNKNVTLNSGDGDVVVKAVEITREQVVLEVEGQRIELRMNGGDAPLEVRR